MILRPPANPSRRPVAFQINTGSIAVNRPASFLVVYTNLYHVVLSVLTLLLYTPVKI